MSKKKDANKEDIIEEAYDEMTQFEDFFVAHWEKILNVAIAVVLVAAVYLVLSKASGKKDIAASVEFGKAKTLAELQKAVETYPTIPAANYARLKIVKLFSDEKKYEEALKICKDITQDATSPETYWQAKLDEGYLLELLGKKNEGAEAFSKIGSDVNFPSAVRREALYSAGRLFLADGKKDRALASLKSSMEIASSTDFFWSEQARGLMSTIE